MISTKHLFIICTLLILSMSCNKKVAGLPKNQSGNVKTLKDFDFTDFIEEQDQLVVVDFYADWCAPCKKLEPTYKKLSMEYEDEVIFARVDYDNNQYLASKYRITGLPSLVLFKNGKEVFRIRGLITETQIASLIDNYK